LKTKEEIKLEISKRRKKAKSYDMKKLYNVVEFRKQMEAVEALEWVIEDI